MKSLLVQFEFVFFQYAPDRDNNVAQRPIVGGAVLRLQKQQNEPFLEVKNF